MKATSRLTPWLFLAPGLAVFGAAVLLPMALTAGFSFTEWNGFGPMTFVGLDNYARALDDSLFQSSFLHVLIYIAATLILEVAVGLGLAGIISARAGGAWFRVAIFTPVMLPAVVVAVLWAFIYNPDFGLINGALEAVGLEQLQRIWLGDPATALLAISVVSGWVFAGFYMMIFYAAFRQVPSEVLEAARLDGAGEWGLFRRIKVPMIRSATGVAIAPVRHRGLPGLRPLLRAHEWRAVRGDGDPHDAPRQDRVPQRRGRLRLGDGGHPHRGRRRGRARLSPAAGTLRAADSARDGWSPLTVEPMAQGLSGIPARASVAPDARGATQIARWLTLGALVLLAALFFFPMVWMVLSSFKTDQAIFASPFALPESIDLSRWVEAWEVGNLGRYALNSAIVTGVSVTLILVMGAMAAFAFSRFRFAGRGLAMGLFALGLLLPLQAYFIAQSNLFTRLAITDTRLGPDHPVHGDGAAARGLPAEGLPGCAARGAVRSRPHRRRERRSRLPPARPAAPAAGPRDRGDLLRARGLERVPAGAPVHPGRRPQDDPDGLLAFSSRYQTDYSLLFSALSIVTIPMVVIYIVFNRHIVDGITAGSVK